MRVPERSEGLSITNNTSTLHSVSVAWTEPRRNKGMFKKLQRGSSYQKQWSDVKCVPRGKMRNQYRTFTGELSNKRSSKFLGPSINFQWKKDHAVSQKKVRKNHCAGLGNSPECWQTRRGMSHTELCYPSRAEEIQKEFLFCHWGIFLASPFRWCCW